MNGIFDSYWTQTETYEALKMYIVRNENGLRDKIIRMIAGEHISINTKTFQNDMCTFENADDILTLLVHLGYLTCDFDTKTAWIPNKEGRQEFLNSIQGQEFQNQQCHPSFRQAAAIDAGTECGKGRTLKNDPQNRLTSLFAVALCSDCKQLFYRKKVLTRCCNCAKMRTERNNVVAIQSRNKKAPRVATSGGFRLIPYKNQAKCCAVVGLHPAQPLVEEI